MAADSTGAMARDLLRQDCQAVQQALATTDDQNDAIHLARKAIRRMRALLALLDDTDFNLQRDDLELRRLGKGLSAMRDAHVVVETARQLQKLDPAAGWDAITPALVMRRTRILQRALVSDPEFSRRRRVAEQVMLHMESQPWEHLQRAGVRAALARSERRVGKAAERAARDGDAEAVHRWRRRVRRLRMQLDAANALGALHGHGHTNAGSAKKAKALHRLSDRLGWLQDLRLLRNLVRSMPAHAEKAAVLGQIDSELEAAR